MSIKSSHTSSIQIVVSRYDLQQKEPKLSEEIVDFKSGAGNLQDKCEIFCHTRVKELSHTIGIISK